MAAGPLCQSRGVDLQYIADRLAITDFLTTYAHAVDAKNSELYRSCFTDDADIDYTAAGGIKGNVDEIVAWMDTAPSPSVAPLAIASNCTTGSPGAVWTTSK